jgi:V8-like Glu-specific endopeptidase
MNRSRNTVKKLFAVPLLLASLVTTSGSAKDLVALPVSPLSSADANDSRTSSDSVKVFDGRQIRVVTSAEATKIITDFWTPQRRRAAKPVSVTVTPGAAATTAPAAIAAGPMRTIATAVRPQQSRIKPLNNLSNFSDTVGKVYFVDPRDGVLNHCSGATVNSGKRRLVLTAGHCVHGGTGGNWMLDGVFIPGVRGGEPGPAGYFLAYALAAQSAWVNNGNYHYDYAFAITQNNSAGKRVVDAVGGNALVINQEAPIVITAIGYPDNTFDGLTQSSCKGSLSLSDFYADQVFNGCYRGPGSSGEPWLAAFDSTSGVGTIVSNDSWGNSLLRSDHGPYYDNDMQALYWLAEGASP